MTDNNVWQMTLDRLDTTMYLLNPAPGIRKFLKTPRKVLDVAVTIKINNYDIDSPNSG